MLFATAVPAEKRSSKSSPDHGKVAGAAHLVSPATGAASAIRVRHPANGEKDCKGYERSRTNASHGYLPILSFSLSFDGLYHRIPSIGSFVFEMLEEIRHDALVAPLDARIVLRDDVVTSARVGRHV